jgi:hypothetical protein
MKYLAPHSTKGYFLVQYKMSGSNFVSKTLPVGRKKGYLFLIEIEKQIFENYYWFCIGNSLLSEFPCVAKQRD